MSKKKEIDHKACIDRRREQIMTANPDVNYVRFDMDNIKSTYENGYRNLFYKTGQRITIGFDHKKKDGTVVGKEEKSFIAHDYCPFCGKKYYHPN